MNEQIVQIGKKRWSVGHKAVGRVIALLEQVAIGRVVTLPDKVSLTPATPEIPAIPEIKTNADDSKKPDMVAKQKRNAR